MWRSLFFAPANRLDLIVKMPRADADNYVLDLEDGTPFDEKDKARASLAEAVALIRRAAPRGRLLVRVNDTASAVGWADLDALKPLDIDGVVVPKCQSTDQMTYVAGVLGESGTGGRTRCIVGGIESVLGVLDVLAIVRSTPLLKSIYFGAEDLAADMGARRTEDGVEVLYARQRVVLAARSAGIAAIDQAVIEIRDSERFARDSQLGRSFAYEGKICLTPGQVKLANELFQPSAEEVAHARALLDEVEKARHQGHGTVSFRGQMVDEPLIKRALTVMASHAAANAQ